MGYTMTKDITDELSFVCSNGDISLIISYNGEEYAPVHLSHEDMRMLVCTWLKCTDIEFTQEQKTALNFDIQYRRG